MSFKSNIPFLGFGLGLRTEHYDDLLSNPPKEVEWLEIISENFMLDGGRPIEMLDAFLERFAIIPHGVSLSIGSTDPLNESYLKKLKTFIKKVDPPWFSDHICWTSVHGQNLHNLMPLPYTDATVNYIAERIKVVQDYIEKPFIFENLSTYVEFNQSHMTEWEFISQVSEKADCGILLDVNNIYVSSVNHEFDPLDYIKGVPKDRVVQYHIAGHKDKGTFIIDTHDHTIRDEVWDLFKQTVPLFDNTSVLIERDSNIPPLADLIEELEIARKIYTHEKNKTATAT